MKKLRKTIFAVLFTGSLLGQFSCTPVACFDETNAFLKASFYLDSTRTQTIPDSVTLYGAGMDTSKIYEARENLKQALIPLNASASNCSLVFRINGIYDTITAWYSTYPHLISEACGYSFYHKLDSLKNTNHIITKIIVINKNITNLSEDNIHIYYY